MTTVAPTGGHKISPLRSREFIDFLKLLDAAYPAHIAIKLFLDNHSAAIKSSCGYGPAAGSNPCALNSAMPSGEVSRLSSVRAACGSFAAVPMLPVKTM